MRLRRGKSSNRRIRDKAYFLGSIRRRAVRWRPLSTSGTRFFEPVPDDVLVGAFPDAGSDRQSAVSAELTAHSVSVGLAVADADRDVFETAIT